MQRFLTAIALSGLLAVVGAQARADVLYTASGSNADSGNSISASANFSITGNTLKITLSNTEAGPPSGGKYVPSDILTGLFFDAVGMPSITLTLQSAMTAHLIVAGDDTGASGISVGNGEEWVYKFDEDGLLPPTIDQNNGLGTAGFGIFNTGGDQQLNYGILGFGFTGANGNKPLNDGTFAQDSIVFTFLMSNGALTEDSFSNVRFQYGTQLTDAHLPGEEVTPVPEPASLAIVAVSGLAGFIALRRNRRRG